MNPHIVKHHVDQFAGAFADIAGTIRFCESQVWAASNDTSMKEETEQALNSIARMLSLIVRLVDWEVQEMERLGFSAREEIDNAERRLAS